MREAQQCHLRHDRRASRAQAIPFRHAPIALLCQFQQAATMPTVLTGAAGMRPPGQPGQPGWSARLQSSPPLHLPHLCALYVHLLALTHSHAHYKLAHSPPSTLPHHPSVPNTSLQHPLFSQSHLNDMASLRRVAAAALCLLALVASASAACTTGESARMCPLHLMTAAAANYCSIDCYCS